MKTIMPCTEVVVVVKVTSNQDSKLKNGWCVRRGTVVSVGQDRICVTMENSHGRVTFVDPSDVFSGDYDNFDGHDEARSRAIRDKITLFTARHHKGGHFLDVLEDYHE